MTKVILPPISQALTDKDQRMLKEWYDKFKFLETLQPLSDIPPAAANVSSIDTATGAITISYPLSRSSQDLRAALTSGFAALGADVALNNTGAYFDGPSVALGTGTWFVTGTALVFDSTLNTLIHAKLWDGTTLISSTSTYGNNSGKGYPVTLSGIITNPAGNVRISVNDAGATTGKILYNQSGNSKDSHITAVRIA